MREDSFSTLHDVFSDHRRAMLHERKAQLVQLALERDVTRQCTPEWKDTCSQEGSAPTPDVCNYFKDRNQQKSVNLKQSPATASVQPGDSVTLQCSLLSKNKDNRVQCANEHSVYWFRAGAEESRPSIIYTHRNSSDEQVERSCVYSLSKTIRSSSDTGTYYCAVVTCGEILFGEGTQVETRSELDLVVLVLGVLLACCVTVITVLIFYINQRLCTGAMSASHHPGHDKSTVDQSTDWDGDAEAENYAALDFTTRKVKRGKTKSGLPQECVYSVVRADHCNQQHPSL